MAKKINKKDLKKVNGAMFYNTYRHEKKKRVMYDGINVDISEGKGVDINGGNKEER